MKINNQLSEIQVNYTSKVKISEMQKVTSSKDALECFRHIWSDKINYIEECVLLLLNRAHKVMGYVKLSSGGTAGTVVDAKVIFQVALKCNASSIILSHNHPSGNINPSEPDNVITKQILEVGKFLGIPLLDHIIITQEGFYSYADEGSLI
jgi:DNA repair protein RadC